MPAGSRLARAFVSRWMSDDSPVGACVGVERTLLDLYLEPLTRIAAGRGERAVVALIRLEEVLVSTILAQRMDVAVLENRTKENLEMAQKARDRQRKALADFDEPSTANPSKQSFGLARRVMPLMLKTKGLAEEAAAMAEERERRAAADDACHAEVSD